MNFSSVELSDTLMDELDAFEQTGRMPHAILVTGGDVESRKKFCTFMSMWAVCTDEHNAPCSECPQCRKVSSGNHIDVCYAKGTGKNNIVGVDEIRSICAETVILPNEAKRKVYVICDADKRMGVEALNAFLKTLEEPVQDILFLMTAEVPAALPQTILSRCTVLSLETDNTVSEEITELAENILTGMVETSELPLLKYTSAFSSRKTALETLPVIRELLSDALLLSVGAQSLHGSEASVLISKRVRRKKIIELIDATSDAINKTNRNVTGTLLATWLCGEYRRITWQK